MRDVGKFGKLLSDTFIFAIGNLFSKLILFLLMPLYTTILTTTEYGVAELLNSAVELLLPIFTLSITEAAYRFSIDPEANHSKIFSAGLSILVKSSIILVLMTAIANYFVKYEFTWYVVWMFFAYALRHFLSNFIRGLGYVKIFAINGVIASIALVFFNVMFLLEFHWGIKGYLLAVIVSNVCSVIYMVITAKLYLYIEMRKVHKELLKEMLVFSMPNIPNLLSWWFVNTSSKYIIVGFSGISDAGLFTAASKLPAMINLLSSVFQQAWQYSSSKEIGKSDCNHFFSGVFKYYSAFILIVCSGLITVTPIISKVLLQGDFYPAWTYVPLLLFSAAMGCYSTFFGTFYLASKKNFMAMVSTFIGAAVNLVVCFALVPIFGVQGALVASVLSYLIIVVIRIIDTRKYARVIVEWPITISAWCILLMQAIIFMLDIPTKFEIVVVLFFAMLLVLFYAFNQEIEKLIKNIIVTK